MAYEPVGDHYSTINLATFILPLGNIKKQLLATNITKPKRILAVVRSTTLITDSA